MSFPRRFALLLDGGFVIKKLQQANRKFPTADDISEFCDTVSAQDSLHELDLLRRYFYHATPATEIVTNPLDGSKTDLAKTPVSRAHRSLIDKVEMLPQFTVRLGEAVAQDWRLGSAAMAALSRQQRAIASNDLVPNISQKGVDLRIGLDIARLSLQQMVRASVVVTGDSDLVPAFKFARREGVLVYLVPMGHGVRRELRAHADIVIM